MLLMRMVIMPCVNYSIFYRKTERKTSFINFHKVCVVLLSREAVCASIDSVTGRAGKEAVKRMENFVNTDSLFSIVLFVLCVLVWWRTGRQGNKLAVVES